MTVGSGIAPDLLTKGKPLALAGSPIWTYRRWGISPRPENVPPKTGRPLRDRQRSFKDQENDFKGLFVAQEGTCINPSKCTKKLTKDSHIVDAVFSHTAVKRDNLAIL